MPKTALPPPPDDAEALAALNNAALLIAAEHQLDKVLQKTVDLARELANARHAALGIPGPDGRLAQFVVSGIGNDQIARIGHQPADQGLLGQLLAQPQSVRLSDLPFDPTALGLPQESETAAFMDVPIAVRGNLLGNLYLADRADGGRFTRRDEQTIQFLAAHAAVAIENAHLFERTRRTAVLEERERIGMDLHDGIIQSIYAVGLSLELSRMVLSESADEAREHLESAIRGLDSIIRDIRSYIMDLQPARIQDDPLPIALERLVREFRANTLIQISLDVASDIDERIADSSRLALFHITQEALANVAKHAHAAAVTVDLMQLPGRVVLEVQDDGAGFDSDKIGGIPGHGLSNMALRARSLGGDLTVTSAPGEGTLVRAVIPIQPTATVPPLLVSLP